MEKITVNLEAATVERRQLSNKPLDFAVINPAYAGKENSNTREAGGGYEARPKHGGWLAVCTGRAATVEPVFVARDPNNSAAAEDDGYLVKYVHDDNAQESKFLVMDARSSSLDIVAAVKLPQRDALKLPESCLKPLSTPKFIESKKILRVSGAASEKGKEDIAVGIKANDVGGGGDGAERGGGEAVFGGAGVIKS
ncbi:hypothetical protein SASPL_131243 [Salvia splendens]|uniref:Uncharacterized protein n=1 Tax=Salvia splendens TaxID=180675 RepID=A0A8X8ZLE5_SALSN|nr:hypothetical protein SASPL_131243 [Salvia splendens]